MPHKVLISGGGTGGHIFPAIAIAKAIEDLEPDTELLFVGAVGKMEMDKIPAAGYNIIGLSISGIKRNFAVSNVLFPIKLALSLIRSWFIIRQFKPNVVVGVGGFASGPVLRVATWMKIPTLIQEQNSHAGLVNRWVAKSVNLICVAYNDMERFFPVSKIRKTGNPVRREMIEIEGKKQRALDHFGFSDKLPVLLIVGGSLGARSVNRAIENDLDSLLEHPLQIIWQTGKHFAVERESIRVKYSDKLLFITQFIQEMDLAYAAADVVVSRAGAIAVSELAIVAKPTILVPFPHAADDHQTKNALALEQAKAARYIADVTARNLLVPAILQLIDDLETRQSFSNNIKQFAKPEAAKNIALAVLELAKRNE